VYSRAIASPGYAGRVSHEPPVQRPSGCAGRVSYKPPRVHCASRHEGRVPQECQDHHYGHPSCPPPAPSPTDE